MNLQLTTLALAILTTHTSAQLLAGTGFNRTHPNLYCYYEASEGVNGSATTLPHGTPVTRWDDLGPGGRHLTRVHTNPTQVANSPATCGLTAVEFNDSCIWADTTDPGFTQDLTSEMTVFIITKPYGGSARRYLYDGRTSRRATFLGQNACPPDWTCFIGGQGTWGCGANAPYTVDRYQFHTVVFGIGKQEHYVDGQLVSSGTYPSVGALGGLVVAGRINRAFRLRGAIKTFAIFDRVITQQERQLVELILMQGLPLGYAEQYDNSGCTDSNNRSPLLNTTSCIMSPGTLELDIAAATPSQPTTLFVSLGRASIPLGPCRVLIAQPMLLSFGGVTDSSGFYSSGPIAVPAGIQTAVNMQALVLDPATAFGGSLSNGLELNYK